MSVRRLEIIRKGDVVAVRVHYRRQGKTLQRDATAKRVFSHRDERGAVEGKLFQRSASVERVLPYGSNFLVVNYFGKIRRPPELAFLYNGIGVYRYLNAAVGRLRSEQFLKIIGRTGKGFEYDFFEIRRPVKSVLGQRNDCFGYAYLRNARNCARRRIENSRACFGRSVRNGNNRRRAVIPRHKRGSGLVRKFVRIVRIYLHFLEYGVPRNNVIVRFLRDEGNRRFVRSRPLYTRYRLFGIIHPKFYCGRGVPRDELIGYGSSFKVDLRFYESERRPDSVIFVVDGIRVINRIRGVFSYAVVLRRSHFSDKVVGLFPS